MALAAETAPAIEALAIGRRYGDVAAADSVSFSVARGEFFALLGPNGAGKTTVMHMLTTLIAPTSGRATVMGFDVVKDASKVRRQLGMVFQDPAVDERLTARENLEIHAVLYGIPPKSRVAAVAQALTWASLADVGERRVRAYSGGMKRRLELARAIMHGPRVLFLDEPTIGLDPQGRRHLWERIGALREEGVTVLMTTHYMPEAEGCDRVGIIDHGKLIAIGSPKDLIANQGNGTAKNLEDVFIGLTGREFREEAASHRDLVVNFGKRGGEHTR